MTITPSHSAITATGLRKSFGDKVVLDGIDLDVRRGHGLRAARPQRRRQDHHGPDPVHADRRRRRRGRGSPATTWPATPTRSAAAIGVTGQFSAVDNLLTGEENLLLMADLHHLGRREGRRRAAELLEQFDLVEAAGKPAATYSGGMRRRLDLAMTLVGDPRIIFLDEPTTGLDPRSRRTMWQIIRELVADGVTIFLTTQYLEEADQLADRIARARPRPAGRRGHRRTSSSAASPAATSGCEFADRRRARRGRPRPRRRRPATTRRSRLQVPSDGSVTLAAGPARPARRRVDRGRRACRSTPPTSTTSSSPSPANPTTSRRRSQSHEHPDLRRRPTRRRCCAAASGTCSATRP